MHRKIDPHAHELESVGPCRTLALLLTLSLGLSACGTNLSELLFQAVAATGRTYVDGVLTDLANDLTESAEPDDGAPEDDREPAGDDEGDSDADDEEEVINDGEPADLTGDTDDGEVLFVSLSCGSCHCADAVGGCALDAPSVIGVSAETLNDFLRLETPHPGGKQDLTDQEIVDFEAYLVSLGGG